MKRLALLVGLALLVALAACNAQPAPTPTAVVEAVVPTEVAPTEVPPTAEPAPAEPVAPAIVADPGLIDTLWVWVSRDAAEPLDVANPHNYNLLFNADGTFFAGLDCNRGTGSYNTPGDGTISIALGPTTMAMCADDSLANQMIAMLGSAASYAYEEEGEVVAFTMADGSVDRYRKADTVPSVGAMPPAGDADTALVGRVWQWAGRIAGDQVTTVDSPEDYSLTFNDDGSFYARLDCNNGGGSYTAAGGTLTMSGVRTTLALCPDGSMAGEMSTAFEQPLAYAIDGRTLTLTHGDGTIDTYTDAAPSLVGTTWQWLGTTTAKEPITVADSSRYTVEFLADGSAVIKADCNNVIAQYTAVDGAMTITPGPSTLVACPEDSQADVFTQQISAAAIYFFMDGDLYIDLFADGGTMRFGELPTVDLPTPEAGVPTGTVNAPDGVFLRTGPDTSFPSVGVAAQGDSGTLIGISEDSRWYVVDAPSRADGRVWVFAEFVDATGAEGLPVVPNPAPVNVLVGPVWQWAYTTTPVETIRSADPTRYTVQFMADGTAAIQADCNRAVVQYTTDGQIITLTPGPMTLAACPEDSQGDLFMQQLSNAAIFFFQGGELFIDQTASAGTMRFVTGATSPEANGGGGATTVTGLPFRVISFGPLGAETPILDGTMIDALFDQAGNRVSGTAGCNNFFGPMNTASGAFKLGPFATTMMMCEENVMAQEAAFLAALEGATSFQWMVQPNAFITQGQINYTLADGTTGVINFVSP